MKNLVVEEKRKALLLILVATIFFLSINLASATGWWDAKWQYRIGVEINSMAYSRTDWPIEIELNFTSLLSNFSGYFDRNSTRLEECNSSWDDLAEIRSQFDEGDNFNETTNAIGTFVFLMNGTTEGNNSRFYYIYFGTTDLRKSNITYYSNFSYAGTNEEEFNVNLTIGSKGLRFYGDTRRGENSSGLYKVQDNIGNNLFNIPPSNENTIEYIQYTNGTSNFTFDLRNSTIFRHAGPIRVVIEQIGNETLWNDYGTISEGRMTKKYTFYAENQWIKIETNFTNNAAYTINRSSTPSGAVVINILAAGLYSDLTYGNSSNPGSWWWYPNPLPVSRHIGVIQINSSSNFFSSNRSELGRGGIELPPTSINTGESVWMRAAFHFNSPVDIGGSPSDIQIEDLRNRLTIAENVTLFPLERWEARAETSVDYTIYNRGENALITINVSYDSSGVVSKLNSSFITSFGDNYTIVLYDDGTHGDATSGDKNFTNYFNISSTENLGRWNVTSYVYDSTGFFLNKSYSFLNVTEVYDITTVIGNPVGLTERQVNVSIHVKNYRKDTFVMNASLNCSFLGTLLNINPWNGNGTYEFNFTAPDYFGLFILNCSVNKSGNQGSDIDYFLTESPNTNLNITFEYVIPGWSADNVTLEGNESFELKVNLSNIGNSTAYNSNVTFALPLGWSANETIYFFGNISVSNSTTRKVLLTVGNGTAPSIYLVNATVNWSNLADVSRTTNSSFNVTVNANPLLNVSEELILAITPPGQITPVGNFTIYSIGNANISLITYNITSVGWNNGVNITFSPQSISDFAIRNSSKVQISVAVPLNHTGGFFNGTVNINSSTGGFDNLTLRIMIPLTNMSIIASPENVTITNMRWFEYRNFSISVNATNTESATAYNVNISVQLPAYWTSESALNTSSCGDMGINDVCNATFSILAKKSLAGNHTFNVTVRWTNPGVGVASNTTIVGVTANENPEFLVSNSSVDSANRTAEHGTQSLVGNFTLKSIGNANVLLENYLVLGFSSNLSVTFNPTIAQFSILSPGQNRTINVYANITAGTPAAEYNGTINITTFNNGSNLITMNVTIPLNRSWTLSKVPAECSKVTFEDEATVCNITINNRGNTNINFSINVTQTNWNNVVNVTYANETSFILPTQQSKTISIWWNVTGIVKAFYLTNYSIIGFGGNPANRTINVSLLPYSAPIINATTNRSVEKQTGSVMIIADVTDTSGAGIILARAIVTNPLGEEYTTDMTLTTINDMIYTYQLEYPQAWAESDNYGYYNVSISATDGVGMTGATNTSFYLHPVMSGVTKSGWNDYFLGESGSVYCNVSDILGGQLLSNVTISVYNSKNLMLSNGSYVTGVNGTLTTIPTFNIPSDGSTGNYTLSCKGDYTPPVSMSSLPNFASNYSFEVHERYNVEFETAIVWYLSETIMTFYIMLYTDNQIEEPDWINFTVYDPAQQVYFQDHDKANFGVVSRTNTSIIYRYQHTISPTTVAGYYLADLSLHQGSRQTKKIKTFRFSEGGPYDLVISRLQSEVERGGTQNFTILLENMGDVPQDVYLDYWISSLDNSTIYASVYNQPVFVDAGANRSFDRSLNIYSDQSVGDYYLHARMRYSTIKPMLHTQQSFRVKEATQSQPPVITPSGGGGGGGVVYPRAAATNRTRIMNIFPSELLIERGGIAYVIMEVKNIHSSEIYKVSSMFGGIPFDWFDTIREIDMLEPGASGYIITKFKIPSDTQQNVYPSKLKVSAIGADDLAQDYNIEVFESKEELLNAKIKKARELLIVLETKSGEVAQEGGDVTNVFRLLERANSLVEISEKYLAEKRLIETMQSVEEASNVLEQARYELSIAKPIKSRIVSIIPVWVYIIVGVFVITSSVTVVLLRHLFKKKIAEVAKIATDKIVEKNEESKAPPTSKDLIDMIRGQYESGHLSKEAYNELRKRYLA
ncbi:MAG: hypothetical protein V1660_03640 [archaeon]